MKVLKAAQVYISSCSPVYDLSLNIPAAHIRDTNDMFVLDTKWLQEEEGEDVEKLILALDSEPGVESWREFELLYIYLD